MNIKPLDLILSLKLNFYYAKNQLILDYPFELCNFELKN